MARAVEIPKTNMRTAKSVAERETAARTLTVSHVVYSSRKLTVPQAFSSHANQSRRARTESNRDGLNFFIVAGKGRPVGGLFFFTAPHWVTTYRNLAPGIL